MKARITPALISQVSNVIETGASFSSACRYADIDPKTGERWLAKGEIETAGLYFDFRKSIEKARAQCEINNVIALNKAANGRDWKAAKFNLERNFKHWRKEEGTQSTEEAELIILDKLRAKLPASVFAQVQAALSDRPEDKTYPDPVEFCREKLGLILWKKQAEIARALTHSRRVAVRSGHKVGKSTLAAAIALWWVHDRIKRPRARVVITAPTDRQVKSIVWKEVRRLYKQADAKGQPIGGKIGLDPGTGLQLEDGREVIGFATDDDERMAGYSGEDILFIADEASGIDAKIFEAIEGNRAGGGSLFMLGNPTQTSGEFFDAFNSKAKLYEGFHIPSYETPNAKGQEHIPGLATAAYCEEKKEEWGEDDPRYQVRVNGDFPSESSTQIIPQRSIKKALEWYPTIEGEGPLVCGLDPARFGDDDSILCIRQGNKPHFFLKLKKGDGPTTAHDAMHQIRRVAPSLGYDPEQDGKIRVCVDVIGIGASVYDALKEHYEEELEIVGVNVSQASAKKKEYVNLRDELWFGLRDWLRKGGTLPKLDKLTQDLSAPQYAFAKNGACKVEPKEDIKKRTGRSPDYAEALMLSLFEYRAAKYTSLKGE
jgi:hypothetical protein